MEEKKEKRFKISFLTHKKLRIIAIICLLFDDFLLLQNAKNDIALYIFRKIQFFTRWSHIITFLYFVLTLIIEKDPKKPKKRENPKKTQKNKIKKKIQKNLSIIFQIAFSTQCGITIMYWLFLHKKALEYITCPYRIIYLYTAHSLPFLNLLLEFFYNDFFFEWEKCLKCTVFLGICYSVFLAFLELNFEIGVYKGIDFKGWLSLGFCMTAFIVNYFGLGFCCYLEKFKYVSVCREDKKVK